MTVLPASFFKRDVLEVAPQLIGKTLCHQTQDGTLRQVRIVEVEAYDGTEDKACHAHKGKTPRNAVMFDTGGQWYIYLCYGIHWLLNITTGPKGYPAAVLIRGAGPYDGPGKLTKHLGIDQRYNQQTASKQTGLWIADDGHRISSEHIERTPRIGVDYAGEWAQAPYRFLYKGPH